MKGRWAVGLFCLATLIVAPLTGRELSRASNLSFAVRAALPDKPIVVVLDRRGGRAFAGKDDPDTLRSGVVERNGYAYLDIPEFVGDDAGWESLLKCVAAHYAPFAVQITDKAPARGDYIRAMIGGPSLDFGFDESVHGIAPWNGQVIRNAVVFVFQPLDREAADLCETAAHEIGHALGLDHSRDCSDVMSYEWCGPKVFVDRAAACGEWETRKCGNGSPRQNTHAALALHLGPARKS